MEGPDRDGQLSLGIAETLARAKGVEFDELDVCLHDYADLSALTQLFGSGPRATPRRGTVSFVVEEWLVVVDVGHDDEAEVTVEPVEPIGPAAGASVQSNHPVGRSAGASDGDVPR